MEAVKLEKVSKWYGTFQVLKDIDLSVKQGEKIVICGPSGSGKSTLIRCINHLEKQSNIISQAKRPAIRLQVNETAILHAR